MCGISGIINFNTKPCTKTAKAMNEELYHRGPDNFSYFENDFATMGMARLKIIDLSDKSNQPFVNYEKKVTVMYNGEIYNFNEIKKEYLNNQTFKSQGDGETILHLYCKFGIDFIKYLKGMFSIAISDEANKKFYLIRDRFGIKPLYYFYNSNLKELSYSSEIQSMFKNLNIKKEPNNKEIFYYLNNSMVNSTTETWFKNIMQLEPSTYIEFSKRSNLKIVKYYSIQDNVDESLDYSDKSFKYWSNQIKEKFYESFNQHSHFDVNGGIHLSGGADSTILAVLANKYKKNLNTYTFDFEEKKYSEVDDAKNISKKLNLVHKSDILENKNVADYLIKVLDIEHEPFSSLRILCQYHLYEKYHNEVKVIFDGSGGDEISAGYTYHIIPWYLDLIKDSKIKSPEKKLSKIINSLKKNSASNYDFLLGSLTNTFESGKATVDGSIFDKGDLIKRDFLEQFKYDKYIINKPFKSHLRNAQYADLKYFKLPRSLRYSDKASMRFSTETRLPFLDHELVELCFATPSKYKILNQQQRIITKYPFKNFINKSLLYKNKATVADPQTFWLRNNLKELVNDTFNSNNLKTANIINIPKFNNLYENFIKNDQGHYNSFFIFQILSTELWLQNCLS